MDMYIQKHTMGGGDRRARESIVLWCLKLEAASDERRKEVSVETGVLLEEKKGVVGCSIISASSNTASTTTTTSIEVEGVCGRRPGIKGGIGDSGRQLKTPRGGGKGGGRDRRSGSRGLP